MEDILVKEEEHANDLWDLLARIEQERTAAPKRPAAG